MYPTLHPTGNTRLAPADHLLHFGYRDSMQFQGLLGIATLLLAGYLLSTSRKSIRWRTILIGLALQFCLAFIVLRFAPIRIVFDGLAAAITRVITFADAGTQFLFGNAADASGPWGFMFAVRVLPVIIFFAALMGILYHLGIMQRLVAAIAWVLRRSMGITGSEALSAAANIFVGQTEAPLTVRPYIERMTRSQLTTIMVGGFATIAGSVMAAYIGMLGTAYEAAQQAAAGESGTELFAKHLLAASLISTPAGIVYAKLLVPETETPQPETAAELMKEEHTTANIADAAAAGASDGLKLALNVAAMLVAFVSLLALINYPLEALGNLGPIAAWRAEHGIPETSLKGLLGLILRPIAWTIGIPWADSGHVGALLGTQLIATEFVAYLDLANHIKTGTIAPRSAQISAYALCGFCNFASIAIQIGGLSAIAPSRRADIASLGLRAMIGGAMACWSTAAVAGLFI